MAIEFKCSTCGKELFAQDQFAGMRTTCPGCQSKMPIPFPNVAPKETPFSVVPDPIAVAAEKPVEAVLIDMEKVVPGNAVEATKRCPMCAEKILVAARKCRFCGEILDEELKRDDAQSKREAVAMAALMVARRSDSVWRGASVLATMLTTGWLTLQTLNCIVLTSHPVGLTFLAPWQVYVFNVLLIGGLFTLIRQMKNGPYHVFLAAAISIVVCMPLDMLMGFPLQGMEQFMAEAKKNDFYKDWTLPDFYNLFAFASGLIGSIISLPVWFTALKLALQERVAKRLK